MRPEMTGVAFDTHIDRLAPNTTYTYPYTLLYNLLSRPHISFPLFKPAYLEFALICPSNSCNLITNFPLTNSVNPNTPSLVTAL